MEELNNQKFENDSGDVIYLTIYNYHKEIILKFESGNEERFLDHFNRIWFNGVYNFRLDNDNDIRYLHLSKGIHLMHRPNRYHRCNV